MTSTLKNKAVNAIIWSATESFARVGIQFGITLILARLLTPTDYGIVGLLSIFFGVAAVFINSGFASALIQRQEIMDVDLSSVFYFNVGIALLFSVLLGLAAPWFASFYNMPVLKPLSWLMSAGLFIGAFGSIQSTLLTRQLNFRRQFSISLTATIVSGSVAVLLAWHKYGVWSLAVSSITATCISTLLLWLLSPWRPTLVFSLKAINSLFRFGSFLMVSSLLDTVFTRLNTLVIGKFYSPSDLGYYSRADSTQQLPANVLTGIISKVAFPIFSVAQQDNNLLRNGLRKAITMVMMLNIPAMLGMAITARPLVFVLFGEQWIPCVPYLQILCLGGILWPLHVLNLNILAAQGYSDLFFRLEVIKKIIGIASLGIASFFSIIAIAWSLVATGIICFVINAWYSGRFLQYGTILQIIDLLPYFAAGIFMVACVWAVEMLPFHAPWLLLTVQVWTGGVIYAIVCYTFRLKAFTDTVQLLINHSLGKDLFGSRS